MPSNTITINIIDREGVTHNLEALTDMNMNLMEVCRAFELSVEGRCGGMAMWQLVKCIWSQELNCLSKQMLS